jgi:CTP synthase
MEIAELPRSQHPFFFGVQFHPELKTRPFRPSPPFFALLAVAAGRSGELGHAGNCYQGFID